MRQRSPTDGVHLHSHDVFLAGKLSWGGIFWIIYYSRPKWVRYLRAVTIAPPGRRLSSNDQTSDCRLSFLSAHDQ